VAAFWTGFGAYYGRCAPHAMIILMTSERIKVAYLSLFGASKAN
jgi:solute carrier family 25 oxoglutarate transporter 11